MSELFADTSGWGNLVDPTQPFHALTAQIYRQARRQKRTIITTNYILTELVSLMTSPLRLSRSRIVSFIDGVKASPFIKIIHIEESTDADAWHLLRTRQDKEWSLVDCASFAVMTQRGLTDALTTDHHFEQAGFVRLLR